MLLVTKTWVARLASLGRNTAEIENASLTSIELLSDLTAKALEDLSKRCSWRTLYINGQVIVRQSGSCVLCFIVKGRARVVNYSLSGREVTVDDRERRRLFRRAGYSRWRAKVHQYCRLGRDSCRQSFARGFHDLLHIYSQFAVRIPRNLTKIMRISTYRINDLSTVDSNKRVHAEFLRLAKPGMKVENAGEISPIPIHGDIAVRVSTTRETVARVFSDLTREGIL